MQTPLIFKLLLLLAFALRLLKINKKTVNLSNKKYFVINPSVVTKQTVIISVKKEEPANEIIKTIYRKEVRTNDKKILSIEDFQLLSAANQLVCVAYQFAKFYEKGGFYRFLWHGNDWLIAFGQSLEIIGHQKSGNYKKLISEIAGFDDTDFDYELIDWESVYPFPEGSSDYKNLTVFEETFDLDNYLREVLRVVS